jgi:rhomboid protease GluP
MNEYRRSCATASASRKRRESRSSDPTLNENSTSDGCHPSSHTSGESIAELEASLENKPAEASRERTNTSLWNYPATYTLIGINVIVFAVMFPFGPVPAVVHAHAWTSLLTASFDSDTLLRFGATSSYYVQHGQWWRLVTGTFVHVTLLHILLNMWCLWNLGLFGEPLLGKRGLIAVYLLTGTAGMMLSFAWAIFRFQPTLVAGASGAVFGIAGILIVLLSNRSLPVPWEELRKLRKQVIFFAAINLVLGLGPGILAMGAASQLSALHLSPDSLPHIDNSAHLGGFLAGLALGVPLFPRMTSGRSTYRHRQWLTFIAAALLLCLFGYAIAKARA